MRKHYLSLIRSRGITAALSFSLWLLGGAMSNGQNLVKNPDFEEPLGPDNWTIVYTNVVNAGSSAPAMCGPSDFFIKGRIRMAHKDINPGTWDGDPTYWSKYGLDFKAGHDGLMHAYARQVFTNLTPFDSYVATAWMAQYEGPLDKVQVWMEVLGGANGQISKSTVYVTDIIKNNPSGWKPYYVTNSASVTGRLEIRLHYNKFDTTVAEKWRTLDGLYDHVSLVPRSQVTYQPPYNIVGITRSNDNVTLAWQSVMNNSYRLQVSSDPGDPYSWALVQWDPYFDPNIYGVGPTTTFTTNVAAMLSYNPTLAASSQLYFRIRGTPFQP